MNCLERTMSTIIRAHGFRDTLPAQMVARSPQSCGTLVDRPTSEAPWEIGNPRASWATTVVDELGSERTLVLTAKHHAVEGESVHREDEVREDLVSKPIAWLCTSFPGDFATRHWIGFGVSLFFRLDESRSTFSPARAGKKRFDFFPKSLDRVSVSHREVNRAVEEVASGSGRPTKLFDSREDFLLAVRLVGAYFPTGNEAFRAPSLLELRDRFGSKSGELRRAASVWSQLVVLFFGPDAVSAMRLDWSSSRFFSGGSTVRRFTTAP